MMNIQFDIAKAFFSDRTLLGLFIAMLILGVGCIIYIALSLEQSDLQVATRYTAFGDTHFYRDKWHYLISFILFNVALIGVHTSLGIKLLDRGYRQLAILLLAVTIFVIAIGWMVARSVLRVAFL